MTSLVDNSRGDFSLSSLSFYQRFVQSFFDRANNSIVVKEMLQDGSFNSLDESDKKLFIRYLEARKLLHDAVRHDDEGFVRLLVDAGYEINTVNTEGKSCLAYASDPTIFAFLVEKGGRLPNESNLTLPLLRVACDRYHKPSFHQHSLKGKKAWINNIATLLPRVSLEDWRQTPVKCIKNLISLAEEDKEIADKLLQIAEDLVSKRAEDAIELATAILGDHSNYRYLNGALILLKTKLITNEIATAIFSHYKVLSQNLHHQIIFETLQQILKPGIELQEAIVSCGGDLRAAIYLHGLLRSQSLKQLSHFLTNIDQVEEKISTLPTPWKKRISSHINALEEREELLVWEYVSTSLTYRDLTTLEKVGVDLNKVDPKTGRNLLFTDLAAVVKSSLTIHFQQKDKKGDNALEFFCRQRRRDTVLLSSIKNLIKEGLTLGDGFPNVKVCREAFPYDPYFQCMLAAIMLHSNKEQRKFFLKAINHDIAFMESIKSHPIACKYLFKDTGQKRRYPNFHQCEWKYYYEPKAQALLKAESKKEEFHSYYYCFLASFWSGERVTADSLQIISDSPKASLVLEALRRQHNNGSKPSKLQHIIAILEHRSTVRLFHYLFENPEDMKLIIDDHMKLEAMKIFQGGVSLSSYATTIDAFMDKLKASQDLQFNRDKSPEEKKEAFRKIRRAFNDVVAPQVVKTIEVDPTVESRLLGRTVVVGGCDAFKFINDKEKYDEFAREKSVTALFRDMQEQGLFQSHFHTPVNIYAVKELPETLEKWRAQLPKNPHLVYHYKTEEQLFTYLNDADEELYKQGRRRSLVDAAKMIRMGVAPDLASLFHNNASNRRYILLIDLVDKYGGRCFSAAGGAGRLDQPLSQVSYPNMRASGLTDLADGRLINISNPFFGVAHDFSNICWNKDAIPYFYQMHNLSCALLVDMLILVDRYEKVGKLDWQDGDFIKELAYKLSEGYVLLSSGYSDSGDDDSIRRWQHFATNCGISWEMMARQIAFWFDNSDKGYPKYVEDGKIPDGIYDPAVDVIVNDKARNYRAGKGFHTDGNKDVLAYNGPLGLSEFEKAAYTLFVAVIKAEP